MAAVHKSQGFRIVGRLIPLDGPDDPEKPVFIDVPHAVFVTEEPEMHEFSDGILSAWKTVTPPQITIHAVQVDGVAYKIHTQAPPEGYFPPDPPQSFDF